MNGSRRQPLWRKRSRESGSRMHLAEINIAKPVYALDDPRIAGFVNRLDAVNAVADRSEGFVWRLQEEIRECAGDSGI